MTRVLIIGAGGVGNVVVRKCAQTPAVFDEILLASRTRSRCDAIAADLDRPIRTAAVDADDVPQLVALIRDFQPSLVINVALPYQDLAIMDACLETGVHYLDTANYEPRDVARFEYRWQWEYDERFRRAGIMALLGSGFDPGVTNVFTAYAAKHHFDEIHELDIIDCNAGQNDLAFATNFNPEINLREVSANGRYWQDGRWVETGPLEQHRTFAFPEGIGEREIYLLFHEELESLVKHFPTLKRARFWMTFSANYLKHLEVLKNVGLTRIDPVPFQGQSIVPLEFLKSLLPDPAMLGSRTTGRTCIGCWVKGVKDGKDKSYAVYNTCDHAACYREVKSQAISYTAGVPAVVGAALMANGTWMKPGVWNMEQLDPDPFMAELTRRGLPWIEVVG